MAPVRSTRIGSPFADIFCRTRNQGTNSPPPTYSVSGGTVVDGILSDGFRYYVFTVDTPAPQGSLIVSGGPIPAPSIVIMAIGGGGGGGSGHGGGGGAGALILLPAGASALPTGTHPVSCGAGGAGSSGPPTFNLGSKGSDTTFGTNPSNFFIRAPGGGRGAGWCDGGDPGDFTGAAGPGGSAGGAAGDGRQPSSVTQPGGSSDSIPTANRFNGNANPFGNSAGSVNNGPNAKAGSGGGGAGTVGQNSEISGTNQNPAATPNHPNFPNGGGGGSPIPGSPVAMASPPFTSTQWPSAANVPGAAGGFGGHGLAVSAFPAPVISPAIPAPNQSNFTTQVTANGYYAAGGGGGNHSSNNPNTAPNGAIGGIGGGGNGGTFSPDTPGTPGFYGTGSGGGAGGSQNLPGGNGAGGVVIVRVAVG